MNAFYTRITASFIWYIRKNIQLHIHKIAHLQPLKLARYTARPTNTLCRTRNVYTSHTTSYPHSTKFHTTCSALHCCTSLSTFLCSACQVDEFSNRRMTPHRRKMLLFSKTSPAAAISFIRSSQQKCRDNSLPQRQYTKSFRKILHGKWTSTSSKPLLPAARSLVGSCRQQCEIRSKQTCKIGVTPRKIRAQQMNTAFHSIPPPYLRCLLKIYITPANNDSDLHVAE